MSASRLGVSPTTALVGADEGKQLVSDLVFRRRESRYRCELL